MVKKSPSKSSTTTSKGRQRGALAAIGVLLLLSAITRAGVGASQALAKTETDETIIEANETSEQPADVLNTPIRLMTIEDDDLMPLLQLLKDREAKLEERELDYAARKETLEKFEAEMRVKLEQLKEIERRVSETYQAATEAAEGDLNQLTEVYANMKPKQAAAVFAEMDPDFAAGFLGRMRSDSAAAILAGMDPKQAYLISAILAGRNADVPD